MTVHRSSSHFFIPPPASPAVAYFVYFKNRVHKLYDNADVNPGPGFYLTLISLPLLLFSGFTVLCGWKKERDGDPVGYDTGYGSKKSRFSGIAMPWKKNKSTAAAGAAASDEPYATSGTYGQRDTANGYNASTINTASDKDNIPLTSRQRVLDAYNQTS